MIAEARLRELCRARDDPEVTQVAEEIERLTAGLRMTTTSIRMIPIGSLFGRFRRVVRDLARALDKSVRLVTEGEDTELDRTVVESLHDPLVHLIRNAIDHGIEPPAARRAAGKPADGVTTLTASHDGAGVAIMVADDGRGLDRAGILARARDRGLVGADAEPSEAELFQLVFAPGFSTAARLSSVSGRGVGMDVVKTAVEALRGTIELTSPPGRGSAVTLRLPLTLAIIDGLLVRVGDQRYVVPLATVEECVELGLAPGASQVVLLHDRLITVLRLAELFGPHGPPANTSGR